VAEALDYAHSRDVVHRDVKPANVLVEVHAGEAGGRTELRPLVTDFGLALRRDAEATLTREGQVLGTPVYMSPEQARGQSHQADKRADVYSLGAVLYEVLCGAPPFRGTWAEVLAQVQHQDPVPLRKVNRGAPRALEGVCLKCLEKDPARRYDSAGEVAAELARYLRGEPVRARPPGPLGRVARWVRRRPASAALVAASLLLFVVGVTGILFFRQAAGARREQELELARSFARPLGQGDASTHLNNTELAALRKLAQTQSDRVRTWFLEEALAEPGVAERLARRADFAAQAAVGLDEGRRQQALDVLHRRLEQGPLDPRVRNACIEIGVALRDGPMVHEAVETSLAALSGTADLPVLAGQGARLAALAEWISPDDVTAAATRVLNELPRIHSPKELSILGKVLAALAERMPPAEAPVTAFAGASAQLLPLWEANSTRSYIPLSRELKSARRARMEPLAARLSPDQAAAAAHRTLNWLANLPYDTYEIWANPFPEILAEDVDVLSRRMRPGDALLAAERALATWKQAHARARRALADAAQALASGPQVPDRGSSARLAFKAKLYGSQGSGFRPPPTVPGSPARPLDPGDKELAELAAAMKPDQLAAAIDETLDLMGNPNEAFPQWRLAVAVLVLAEQRSRDPAVVPPADIQKVFRAMARDTDVAAVRAALKTSRLAAPPIHDDDFIRADAAIALKPLSQAASLLATHLDPGDAAGIIGRALDTMDHTNKANAPWALLAAAGALAGRLEPGQAATLAAAAVRRAVLAAARINDENSKDLLAASAANVAGLLPARIKAEIAASAAQKALDVLSDNIRPSPTCSLVAALGELAERITPADAPALAAAVAQMALDSLVRSDTSLPGGDRVKAPLTNIVSALAGHLSPGQADGAVSQVLDAITGAQARRYDNYQGRIVSDAATLAKVQTALAARIEPARAEAIAQQGLDTIRKSNLYWYQEQSLGKGIAAMAGRVRPAAAATLELLAIDAISEAPGVAQAAHKRASEKIRALGDIAAGLAPSLSPDAAVAAARRALAAAARTQDMDGEGFEAFIALGEVTRALGRRLTTDNSPQGDVLTVVGKRLSSRVGGFPDEKNTLRALAAVWADPANLDDPRVVVEAVHKEIRAIVLSRRDPALVQSLALLAPRLAPQASVGAIRQLIDVMRVTNNPPYNETDADPRIEAVALLAQRVEPDQARALVSAALGAITRRPIPPSPLFHGKLAGALAARMKPDDAADALQQALDAMNAPINFDAFIEAITGLSKRLRPDDAAGAAQRIVSEMANPTGGAALLLRAKTALSLAHRMDAASAAAIIRDMANPLTGAGLLLRAKVVVLMAQRMDATAAAPIIRSATDRAVRAMIQNPDLVHDVLRWVVPTLAAALEPRMVESLACTSLAGAIEVLARVENVAQSNPFANSPRYPASASDIKDLAEAARALAVKAKSADAAGPLGRGLDVMSLKTDPGLLQVLEVILAALADRIKGEAAPALARRALSDMTRTKDRAALGSLGRTASRLAGRMEARAGAAVVVAAALRALARTGQANEQLAPWCSEEMVIERAIRLSSPETRAAAQQVLDAFMQLKSSAAAERLGIAAGALASSIDALTARALAGVTAQTFLDILGEARDTRTILSSRDRRPYVAYKSELWKESAAAGTEARKLAAGIDAVAKHMNSDEAAVVASRAAHLFMAAFAESKAPSGICNLGEAVALLAARMEPAAAEAVALAAADRLLDSAANEPDGSQDYVLQDFIEAMAALVERMSPPKAAATAKAAVRRIIASSLVDLSHNRSFSPDAAVQRDYRPALADLVAQMEPAAAAAAAEHALDTMGEYGPEAPYLPRAELVGLLLTRCTSAGLVELLKQPECVRERRRAILREWTDRQHRPFCNIWDFVLWVPGHDPRLNLKSPPQPFPAQDPP
jgi:hypothetical protein